MPCMPLLIATPSRRYDDPAHRTEARQIASSGTIWSPPGRRMQGRDAMMHQLRRGPVPIGYPIGHRVAVHDVADVARMGENTDCVTDLMDQRGPVATVQ